MARHKGLLPGSELAVDLAPQHLQAGAQPLDLLFRITAGGVGGQLLETSLESDERLLEAVFAGRIRAGESGHRGGSPPSWGGSRYQRPPTGVNAAGPASRFASLRAASASRI